MTHYDLNHAFMGCISLHHLFTFLIRRISKYSKHEVRIRLDEYMEMYGSTNRIFDPEYSNIRIRPNKNAIHWALSINAPQTQRGFSRETRTQWSKTFSSAVL